MKFFHKPEFEIIKFVDDIITTSGTIETKPSEDKETNLDWDHIY